MNYTNDATQTHVHVESSGSSNRMRHIHTNKATYTVRVFGVAKGGL